MKRSLKFYGQVMSFIFIYTVPFVCVGEVEGYFNSVGHIKAVYACFTCLSHTGTEACEKINQ